MLLGIKLQASGLMTSAFIYWAMLPAFFFFFYGGHVGGQRTISGVLSTSCPLRKDHSLALAHQLSHSG